MRFDLPTRLRSSIQAKIAVTVLVAVLSAVSLTAVTSALREADRRFQSKRTELGGIAAALSASVARDLADMNQAGVGRTLTAIGKIPDVAFAQVLDAKGRSVFQLGNSVVLERHDRRVSPNGEIGLFSTLFLRNYILETPVVSGGETIGTLRIIANISSLETALSESILSALLAAALATALGLLLARKLQSRITAPIQSLTAAIGNVRSRQDFTLTVERTSQDETGLMVDAFNDMLSHIRARDRRLAEHRDRLESEVEERTAELKAATVAAQSANNAKSEFLATMSHEIRTPLNGMLVMAELLSTGDLPDRMQRHADVIVSSGQSLLAIINDILDLSKIEAGRMEIEMLPVEPETVAEQVTGLFAARAAGKGLDLAGYCTPAVPRRIAADPVRLNQILANLVNNALKFTEQGSVTLRVEVEGDAPAPGAPCRVRFSVTDTGIGIPEDKLAAIFDPFTQADQSTTRRFGGTGIGLSISRRLVAAMGGELTVTSSVGKGSTFGFTIPTEAIESPAPRAGRGSGSTALIALPPSASRDVLEALIVDLGWTAAISEGLDALPEAGAAVLFTEPATIASSPRSDAQRPYRIVLAANVGDVFAGALIDDNRADHLVLKPFMRRDVLEALTESSCRSSDERGARPRPRPAAASRRFSGVHVLAADDSAINREVIAEALARLDVNVTLVEDGGAAVAETGNRAFDLVLMDCSMPVMDGYAATRAIRSRESEIGAPPVPIIALTAHVAGMHATAWREAGMSDTLSKPFSLKGLTATLERWLGASRRSDPGQAPLKAAAPAAEASAAALTPILDPSVLEDIREMQDPDDDLVGRIIALYEHHAPPALARLETALAAREASAVAETAHALKSLCRNIGAARLGNRLHEIEARARAGDSAPPAAGLSDELALVIEHLGAIPVRATERLRVPA